MTRQADEIRRMADTMDRLHFNLNVGPESIYQEAAAMLREYAEGVEWRPIETAPKDGTTILVGIWLFMEKVKWDVRRNHWTDGFFYLSTEPTHWRPLPSYAPNITAALSGREDA